MLYMKKKYFIYISSTEELKTERRELIKIITELDAVPVTLDGFDVSETENQGFIKKAISESDYFINLTAYNCGVMNGKNYVMDLELSLAEKLKIPVISFIIDPKARWKAAKKEKDKTAIKALELFKKRLMEHSYAHWLNSADLRLKALTLISRELSLNPGQGWIRGDDAVTPATANELARLIRENEQLRTRIILCDDNHYSRQKSQIKTCLKMLASNRISLSFWYVSGENWENTKVFRYLQLFKLLAPELYIPKTTSELSRFLGNILNPNLEKTVRKDFPTPTNTIKKITADLCLLRLVRSLKEGRNNTSGEDEAWEITEYGREVFTVYRLRQMSKNMAKNQEQKSAEKTI